MKTKRQLAASRRPRNPQGKFTKTPADVVPSGHVRHINTFAGIPHLPSNIYRNLDEAIRDSPSNAKAMRRDPFILDCLFAREMATAELPHSLEVDDETDPYQKYVANELDKIIDDIPRFTEMKRNLMEAAWFGRYATVMDYRFTWNKKNERRMVVNDWIPLHGDKLCFHTDNSTLGYLVGLPTGYRESVITPNGGRAEWFDATEREAVIVHKHMIQDGQFDEPEIAAGIHGVGLRSQVYWGWWQKQELMGWIFDTLERYGMGGIQIWYFEAGNDASEAACREAAEKQTGNNIILMPRPVGTEKQGPGLEIVSPQGAGLDVFMALIDDHFNAQIKRLIVGQSLTSETGSTGMGSGVSEAHQDTFSRLVRYDADNLSQTLTQQLVAVLLAHNFPDADFKVRLKLAVDRPDPAEYLEAAQRFYEMGGEIDEQELRQVIGLSTPKAGAATLKKSAGGDDKIQDGKVMNLADALM